MTTKIQQIKQKMKEIDEEIKTITKNDIFNEFKDLFEKYEQVEAIRWEQYAPYFNDGDPCAFSVYDLMVKGLKLVSEENVDDYEDSEGFFYNYELNGSENEKCMEEFMDVHSGISEKIMEEVLTGDGRVTISRNGKVKIEEVDHD